MAGQEAMYTGVSGHDWSGNSVWGLKPEGNDHGWFGSSMYGCEGLRETKMGSLEAIVMGIRIHRERPWLFQKFLQACRLKQKKKCLCPCGLDQKTQHIVPRASLLLKWQDHTLLENGHSLDLPTKYGSQSLRPLLPCHSWSLPQHRCLKKKGSARKEGSDLAKSLPARCPQCI